MQLWKQAMLGAALTAGAVWVTATQVPGGRLMLDQAGLGLVLDRVGLAPSAEPQGGRQAQGGWSGGGGGPARVVAEPPGVAAVADSVASIGDGKALRSVAVVPQAPGRIAAVLVTSGDRVEAGQILVQLDDAAESIALERARLLLDDARARVDRVERLRGSGTTTDVQIREAELALRQAELGLRQAEFDLAQRRVTAPIGGWIGILNAEVGAQVGPTVDLAQIDDRSALLVDFRLPERLVGRLAPGDTVQAQTLAAGFAPTEGRISAIDNRVDPASRTLRVQARLDNADDRLRAGMAFSIRIDLPGEEVPSVDPLAVQWSREGAYVWVVRDGKASRVAVRIVQRADAMVLVRADFQPGDLVIVEGVQAVRPGAPVEVIGAGPGPEALRPGAPEATRAAAKL